MITLRKETLADHSAVEKLLDTCFGTERHAKASYRLRDSIMPVSGLSFVAQDKAGSLVGTIRFWACELVSRAGGDAAHQQAQLVLLLGPLAVAPQVRGQKVGQSLIERGVQQAHALGFDHIFLVGDADYYSRFGFVPVAAGRLCLPGGADSHRILSYGLKTQAVLPLEAQLCPSQDYAIPSSYASSFDGRRPEKKRTLQPAYLTA